MVINDGYRWFMMVNDDDEYVPVSSSMAGWKIHYCVVLTGIMDFIFQILGMIIPTDHNCSEPTRLFTGDFPIETPLNRLDFQLPRWITGG